MKSAYLSLLIATAAVAVEPLTEQPRPLARAESTAGSLAPDVQFTDIEGRSATLRGLAAKQKALVVAFTSPTCPLSAKLLPTLAAVEKEFAGSAAFLYVNPTASDKMEAIRASTAQHGLKGAMVHDKELTLAGALKAASITEAFVLDAAGTILYRGAVDDQYGLGYAHDAPRNEWLRDALRAALAGQRPRIAATTAPGCVILLPDKKAPVTASVTWHGRVSRILQANCQECHRTGGIAPFPLETMEDAVSHAGMIKKAVTKGIMPPWFSEPQHGVLHSPFSNDRSLTAADKADLLAWLDGGRPAGDAKDAPIARQWPDAEWAIGKPDTIWELPREVSIKATGKMGYVNLQVPTGLTEDRWVQSIEVLPTARGQVHHVLIFAAQPDKDGKIRVRDGNNFFAAYVPGSNLLQYPAGYAKRLPAGTVFHFQLHYTPTGTATTDRTRLGVVFAKEPPRYEVNVAAAGNHRILIPAGAANHTEKGILPVAFNAQILAFMPHMHVRGKSFRYELVLPDNSRRTLLDVPRYDFNWQLLYRLAEPLTAPAGSRIEATAVFDNSTGNPANPDPTKVVRWGEQTDDEMLLGYVEYVNPAENPSLALASNTEPLRLTGKSLGILGKRLDKDGDGRVSREEAGTAFAKLHTQLDTNGDGFVTADESRAALRKAAEERRKS
jgi:thiol-disulfide isomerase/thioredoxin/mono/diheme cytochrome c family protein